MHLAGIFALALQGIGRVSYPWIPLIFADAMLAMNVRSGLLAFMVAALVSLILKPRIDRLVIAVGAITMLVATMGAFDLRLSVPGTSREFSLQQLTDSVESVIGRSPRTDLEGTKQWRLSWWGEIVDYTVRGPFFWRGKGYGVNLADSDGYQVGSPGDPLRSPHNSHLTVLARSGVPGFLLWLAVQITWVATLLGCYLKARALGAENWVAIFGWLVAYWLAFAVAAGFDVFLEGPMAGIPFWSIFGLGWGACLLFNSQIDRPPFPKGYRSETGVPIAG